jgi:hypothetical protein
MKSKILIPWVILNNHSTWKEFEGFVQQFVGVDVLKSLRIAPTEDTPSLITAWIFLKCEIPDPKIPERASCQGYTYSTALRMRAAVSFYYNQLGKSGNWNQMLDGSWAGNPSLSTTVSRYMLSLQKRKVSLLCNQS